jgi:hypothetical protein
MLRFDWDALRVGDSVRLHDRDQADLALVPGIVAMVDTKKRSNGIGIRIGSTKGKVILWPSRLAVHLDPRDPTEECWRCQALAAKAEGAIGVQPEGAPA